MKQVLGLVVMCMGIAVALAGCFVKDGKGGAKAGGPVFQVSDRASTIDSAKAVFDWLEDEDRSVFVGMVACQVPLLNNLKRLSGKTGAEIVAMGEDASADDGSAMVLGMYRGMEGRDEELRRMLVTTIGAMFDESGAQRP